MGWHFGFKLHLIINDYGELLAFQLTPANVDERKPVPDMTKDLIGKLFGDRGYNISLKSCLRSYMSEACN